jgi:2-oxoacid:acceptor oxidoreductase gamma subunit (pyruvate/2-ketoisovalerate family)
MRKILEIKCIGRGGQGAVTFSQLLAIAAFYDGLQSQAFPSFGVERRGAPSFSFTRIAKGQCIGLRSQIYTPDIVVVLDPSLLSSINVAEGLKKNGHLIINSKKSVKEIKAESKNYQVCTVDATSVALKIFKADIPNTPILGAVVKATKIVTLNSVYKAIEDRFKGKGNLIELNKKAVKEVYESVKKP